jgi:Sec-independent protein translocase protein TatA
VVSAGSVGRATTAARGAGRVLKERQDVGRASDTVETVRAQQAELEAQLQAEVAALQAQADPLTESLETVSVRPKKTQITVRLVSLAWAPHWRDAAGAATAAWT